MGTTTVCCKLLLGLLFWTTMTVPLGAERLSRVIERHRPRQSIIGGNPSVDRYGISVGGKTSNVAAAAMPPWHRMSFGDRVSRGSAVLHTDVRDAETIPLNDDILFPVKRRWNHGNLRVWGKRSLALPATSLVHRRPYGDNDNKWLLPARMIYDEQLPSGARYDEGVVWQTPRDSAGSRDNTLLRVNRIKRRSETTNHRDRFK